MKMKVAFIASILLMLLISPVVQSEDDEGSTFSLTGSVFTFDGSPANSTSIKVDSMQSSWSDNGLYVFHGIASGEHTVRAYFMNDGHTVVYRKILVDSDISLDWFEGRNWITFRTYDEYSSGEVATVVDVIETSESIDSQGGMETFGPYEIGQYYTIRAHFGDDETPSQYIRFKMDSGSSSNPWPNDFEFRYGHNSKYGYLRNTQGAPVEGAVVSMGGVNSITNSDGFFLIQNLEIGTMHTITANHWGIEIADPVDAEIVAGEGWLNITSTLEPNFPEPANFTTQIATTRDSPVSINWEGGSHTDYFTLYGDGEMIYKGNSESFVFEPSEPGTHVFRIESVNSNGSIVSPRELQIIVLPPQSSSDLWSSGMSWSYYVLSTPEYHQNKTYTAIGSEKLLDAFGRERDTYLVRVSDEEYEEGEKAFRWVDSSSLLNIKTYWSDAPEISSYYQEGSLGWNFTASGVGAELFSQNPPTSLHFNRTNIIGVPGHPNGYDDTMNTVFIERDVEITTQAGDFRTTYISIVDTNDNIVSWELWYNSTVRNYVKIIDRLPGSHSDTVIYELTSYDVPTTPRFITEEDTLFTDDDYSIDWADFQGATNYELFENGKVVYAGDATSFKLEERQDGEYTYRIVATMPSGETIAGDPLSVNVVFALSAPVFTTPSDSPMYISESKGESVSISWVLLSRYDMSVLTDDCSINGECDSSIDYETMAEVDWYSLTVEIDGEVREIYNGSQATTVIDLEPGQYRLRVKAYSSLNGAESGYSDSTFVIVEESSPYFSPPWEWAILAIILVVGGFSFSSNALRTGTSLIQERD